MSKKIIVQRLEEGSRCEYEFISLHDALKFIEESERLKKADDGGKVDGAYELYMPRSYS